MVDAPVPETVIAPVMRSVGEPLTMEPIEVAPPGPGEVRVRMAASGVCHSCLHAWDGSHGGVPLPVILGDEGAGIVESIGSGVTRVQVGDPVVLSWVPVCGVCRFCTLGRQSLCIGGPPLGVLGDGTPRFATGDSEVYHFGPATYAPLSVVAESAAIPIDPRMPLDRAAMIGCAVATGVGAVARTANAGFGDAVVVVGCGGVGLNAIQGAVLVGADPIVAVDVQPDRLELAQRLGATGVVDARTDDAADRLDALSPGGFDVTIVAVGSAAALELAWSVTGRGGTCVVVGKTPDGVRIDFDPQTLGGERRLVGSTYGSVRPSIDFPSLVGLYLSGRLKLDELVSHRFELAEANEAFDALRAGELARGLISF